METNLADGQLLKEIFASGTTWLEKSVPDINAINVFPVPDGDTGTNMLLTMRSAMEEATGNSDSDASSVVKSLAYGALMGARGNSGVILSQFWRGLARGLEDKSSFDGKDFAKALAEASQAAYEGIIHPVEGTMLTVLKDAAEAADKAAKACPEQDSSVAEPALSGEIPRGVYPEQDSSVALLPQNDMKRRAQNDMKRRIDSESLVSVLEAAVEAARDSVARTPTLLAVLKEAGVVDAGGQGIYVLLDGALRHLKGEQGKMQYRRPRLVAADLPLTPKMAPMGTEVEVPYGYCTNFVLKGQSLDLKKIKGDLKKKGQSLIVTGDKSLVRVHIHSFEPGEIINYAAHLGTLHQININNMDDQYVEFIKMQKERLPTADIAIVAVASGDGFFEVFNSLGTAIIVPGGQTMNPSVRQLVQAVESAPSNNVILLPNNKNIILTASQVEPLTSKKVKVVPTKTVPQGIAAFLAFSYEMNLEENAQAMEETITAIQTIEITKAVRKTQLNGLKIKRGQFIAILNDGSLIASGKNISEVIFEALPEADIDSAAVMTIYYGAETQASEAESIAWKIQDKYSIQVEIVRGGQPYYNYIISLE